MGATIDLRTLRLRSGEQLREVREVELEPFELGGERYSAAPTPASAGVTVSRITSGLPFELDFEARLAGPCMRCLADSIVTTSIRTREYQATSPGEGDELRTGYVDDDLLDVSAWARDAVGLALPDQILCHADCAGLCAACGVDLNIGACTCGPPEPDPRWLPLAELRDRL